MKFISYISVFMIPVLILYILGYGLIAKRNIYNDFVEGAEEGLKIVWRLVPTLIGLMTAVGVLRASGFLEFPTGLMAALMLSATESVFYCMSVYFGSVGVQKTRYTLPGALLASLAGMMAAVCIGRLF